MSAVKYLYKYVYKGCTLNLFVIIRNNNIYFKGYDRATFTLRDTSTPDVDEIDEYVSARYVSTSEACWRIFHFPLHEQYPRSTRLQFHLENAQNVYFKDNQLLSDVLQKNTTTQLTAYFDLNRQSQEAANILFHDMPKYYSWCDKKWKKRKK